MMPVSLPTASPSSNVSNLQPWNSSSLYPMQFFYYPTGPISPSIYLPTGSPLHQGPITLVLRGKNAIFQMK